MTCLCSDPLSPSFPAAVTALCHGRLGIVRFRDHQRARDCKDTAQRWAAAAAAVLRGRRCAVACGCGSLFSSLQLTLLRFGHSSLRII